MNCMDLVLDRYVNIKLDFYLFSFTCATAKDLSDVSDIEPQNSFKTQQDM